MKVGGIIIDAPEPEVLVIPRKGGDIIFKAKAVTDYTRFDELCPRPTAPERVYPGGKKVVDSDDKTYLTQQSDYATKRLDWMIIESLSATEDLIWDDVKSGDPDTWENARKELQASFPDAIAARIISLVYAACGLDQDKIDEATDSFLAGQGGTQPSESSPSTDS